MDRIRPSKQTVVDLKILKYTAFILAALISFWLFATGVVTLVKWVFGFGLGPAGWQPQHTYWLLGALMWFSLLNSIGDAGKKVQRSVEGLVAHISTLITEVRALKAEVSAFRKEMKKVKAENDDDDEFDLNF